MHIATCAHRSAKNICKTASCKKYHQHISSIITPLCIYMESKAKSFNLSLYFSILDLRSNASWVNCTECHLFLFEGILILLCFIPVIFYPLPSGLCSLKHTVKHENQKSITGQIQVVPCLFTTFSSYWTTLSWCVLLIRLQPEPVWQPSVREPENNLLSSGCYAIWPLPDHTHRTAVSVQPPCLPF